MYTNVHTEVVSKRCVTENTVDIFIAAFSSTPPLSRFSVNDLVYHLNYKITNVITPTKVKVASGKKKNLLEEMSKWKKGNVEKLSARGEKQISRFILTFIKRDFTFLTQN